MFSTRLERRRKFQPAGCAGRRGPARGRDRLDRGLGGAGIRHAPGGGGGSCADHNRGAHRIGRSCRPVPYRLRRGPGCRPLHIALMEGVAAFEIRCGPLSPFLLDVAPQRRAIRRSAAMSTTAIVILVAIGLVIMMQLNGRARDQEDSTRTRQGFITCWLYSRCRGCPRYHCSFSSGVPRLFLAL